MTSLLYLRVVVNSKSGLADILSLIIDQTDGAKFLGFPPGP